jgi:carbamoyltransferase
MIVLGIHDGHNGTSSLLRDGRLVACVSEERLTRLKNQAGYPKNSIDTVLKIANVRPSDVDIVAFGSRYSIPGDEFVTGKFVAAYRRKYSSRARARHAFLSTLRAVGKYEQYAWFRNTWRRENRISAVISHLGIGREKIRFIDHHSCHAATAYFGSGMRNGTLVLTCDGEGDGLCATVGIGKGREVERISSTPSESSLGNLYSAVTFLLGMKPLDHEYKVMGLAPYADATGAERSYQKLRGFIDRSGLQFLNQKGVPSQFFYKALVNELLTHRFDWIAGAIQRITEELLMGWTGAAIEMTGLRDVACSGGVFMNVKANMRLVQELDHSSMFIFPSSGDESVAIGAAYHVVAHESSDHIEPIRDLYLGPEFDDETIKATIENEGLKEHCKVEHYQDIEGRIAELLVAGAVVARLSGRMEWGARALGNRSIITNPSNLDSVMTINQMIKMRDFWMPFAPTLMETCQKNYLVNEAHTTSPYMMLAFNTRKERRKEIIAALHQYDFTVRPQILEESWNGSYYRILKLFHDTTGIGGVLNTSFNLHGEPIVCSPNDAVSTMMRSGLDHLSIGPYLIVKQ